MPRLSQSQKRIIARARAIGFVIEKDFIEEYSKEESIKNCKKRLMILGFLKPVESGTKWIYCNDRDKTILEYLER